MATDRSVHNGTDAPGLFRHAWRHALGCDRMEETLADPADPMEPGRACGAVGRGKGRRMAAVVVGHQKLGLAKTLSGSWGRRQVGATAAKSPAATAGLLRRSHVPAHQSAGGGARALGLAGVHGSDREGEDTVTPTVASPAGGADRAAALVGSGGAHSDHFDATGDRTRRKLLPALYELQCAGAMNGRCDIIGTVRTSLSEEQFRSRVREAFAESKEAVDTKDSRRRWSWCCTSSTERSTCEASTIAKSVARARSRMVSAGWGSSLRAGPNRGGV